MPKIDLDFGGVGDLPDEGYYRLRCDKAIYKPNKTKDGFIINLQMSAIDMPEDQSAFENHKVFDNASIKLAARWRLKEVLEGFTGQPWDEDGMGLEIDPTKEDAKGNVVEGEVSFLEDATCIALCYHDDYNGKLSLKVKNYYPDNEEYSHMIGANGEEPF